MTNSWLLQRMVELIATYLIHSTIFLGGLAIFTLPLISRRFSQGKGSAVQFSINPAWNEWLWKLAAILPLATTSFTVFAGWSRPLLEWSISTTQDQRTVGNAISEVIPVQVDEPTLESTLPKPTSNTEHVSLIDELPEDAFAEAHPFDDENPLKSDGKSIGDFLPGTAREHRMSPVATRSETIESDVQLLPSTAANRDEAKLTFDPKIDGQAADPPARWVDGVGVLFLAWIILSALRLLWRAILIQRYVSGCRLLTGDVQNQLARMVPGRVVDLRSAERQQGSLGPAPFACGLWKWTIVLPEEIDLQLTHAEMKGLLAHEVAHLIRRDTWWQYLGEILCTCLAFQPLNFLARRRWQQSAELLCDDWAVRQHVSATTLAHCLTRIAELRFDRSRQHLGLAAIGQPGSLAHRIEWLLRSDRSVQVKPRIRVAGTGLAFILGILVGAFGPRMTLSHPAEAAQEHSPSIAGEAETAFIRAEIEHDLAETLLELNEIQSGLSTDEDVEIAAAANRLQTHLNAIKSRLDAMRADEQSR